MKKVKEKFLIKIGMLAVRAAEKSCNEVSFDDFYQPVVPKVFYKLWKADLNQDKKQ